MTAARELAARGTHALVNSLNPYRIEGQKTAAFEIVEELGVPDVLTLPYGGGGNTRAYVKGFDEAGAGLPRLVLGESTCARNDRRIGDPHRATRSMQRKSSRR